MLGEISLLVLHQMGIVIAYRCEHIQIERHFITDGLGIVDGVRRHADHATGGHLEHLVTNVIVEPALHTDRQLFEIMLMRIDLDVGLDPVHHHDHVLAAKSHPLDALAHELALQGVPVHHHCLGHLGSP